MTVCALLGPTRPSAEANGARWTVTSVSYPTSFAAFSVNGEEHVCLITTTYAGDSGTDGVPITITEEPPEALALDPSGVSSEGRLAVVAGARADMSKAP